MTYQEAKFLQETCDKNLSKHFSRKDKTAIHLFYSSIIKIFPPGNDNDYELMVFLKDENNFTAFEGTYEGFLQTYNVSE